MMMMMMLLCVIGGPVATPQDKEGYPKFPYCLVLFAGEQTLQTILSNPRGLRPVMPQQQLLHIFRSLAEVGLASCLNPLPNPKPNPHQVPASVRLRIAVRNPKQRVL